MSSTPSRRDAAAEARPALLRVHHFASVTHLDNAQALTAELKALSCVLAPRVGQLVGRAQQPPVPAAAVGARAPELESRARRHGASVLGMNDARRHRRDVDWRDARRARTPSEARSLVLRGRAPTTFARAFGQSSRQGFIVEGVTTPCGALWSQARLRRRIAAGRSARARGARRVAIGAGNFRRRRAPVCERSRLGLCGAVASERRSRMDRELLADRLSAELRRSFLYLKQYWEQDVSQVLLCGDMPEIRSLTAPLIDRLNIEVETLDTLDGIDTATLPDRFCRARADASIGVVDCGRAASGEFAARRSDGDPDEQDGTAHRRAGYPPLPLRSARFCTGRRTWMRIDAERQLDAVRREMSSLQAQVVAANAAGAGDESESARRAALDALDAQGPAMARVLEAVGNAAPQSVTLRSLRAMPDGDHWNVSFDAFAAGTDQTRRAPGRRRFPARAGRVADLRRAASAAHAPIRAGCRGRRDRRGVSGAQMKSATLDHGARPRLTTAMAVAAPVVVFGFLYVLQVQPERAAAAESRSQLAAARDELNRRRDCSSGPSPSLQKYQPSTSSTRARRKAIVLARWPTR